MSKYWDKRLRDQEIVKLHQVGKNSAEIAKQFKVSRRTVERAIKDAEEVRDGRKI